MKKVVAAFGLGALLGLVPWVRSTDFASDAVFWARPWQLRLYLFVGGDPNALTPYGPLLYDIPRGKGPDEGASEILRMLIAHGASITRGVGSDTPLMNASGWCWLEGVKILVAAGADPHVTNERGQTARDTVCNIANDADDQVVEYLTQVMASNNALEQNARPVASVR